MYYHSGISANHSRLMPGLYVGCVLSALQSISVHVVCLQNGISNRGAPQFVSPQDTENI